MSWLGFEFEKFNEDANLSKNVVLRNGDANLFGFPEEI